MAPLKGITWAQRDRNSKLASVMWPDLADAETQKEMEAISAREGKVSPTKRRKKKLLSNAERKFRSPLGGSATIKGKKPADEEGLA
jgi:hypothetical protein